MATIKTCEECGIEFSGRGCSKYCSTECYFWNHTDMTPGYGPQGDCWRWTGEINPATGYGQTQVPTCGMKSTAHRHAYRLAHGVDPGELSVLHRCDVRDCCNPTHLFLGTSRDNWKDALAKGRMKVAIPKLTTEEVQAIRRSSDSVRELAARHKVAKGAIRGILEGRSWKHVA